MACICVSLTCHGLYLSVTSLLCCVSCCLVFLPPTVKPQHPGHSFTSKNKIYNSDPNTDLDLDHQNDSHIDFSNIIIHIFAGPWAIFILTPSLTSTMILTVTFTLTLTITLTLNLGRVSFPAFEVPPA